MGEWHTIPALVRWSAVRYADHEAVVEGRTRITYAELGARVERAAAACLASGVVTGDRVAVWAPNSLDWIVAALGAVSAGGVLVPLNTRLKGGEAVDVLRASGARLLFVTGPFLGTSYVAALRGAAASPAGPGPLPAVPSLREVVVLSGEAPPEFRTWREFSASGREVGAAGVARRSSALRGDSVSDVVFTSGTTGRPKGVVVTHGQTLRAYETWADLAGLRAADRYLIINPFSHTFGYKAGVLACLMRGATMIPQPVSDVDTTLARMTAERVSVLPGPPTLHQSLLDHPARAAHDLSALRLVVTGAAVIPPRLVERLRTELGVGTVLTAYGLSEATGMVTMCRRGDDPAVVAATSGRAIPGVEVRVVSAAGTPVPAGSPGEIWVRGFNVMRGYDADGPATAEAITPEGWLRTGDIGVLDTAGNLRVTDRLKDMFTVGGFNAYPAEIERLLSTHPEVADAAVVGVPHPRLGEVPKAYVVRRPGSRLTATALITWSRHEMANYKVPREVEFVAELPRNAGGKVLKEDLRGRAPDDPSGR
ncbi:FadD3 family acyl-CoA ligase [Streptomyces malaysiense]|uniref:Fatty acid--CoA ligase n=1 Tax=Streptomyces malaysiense TaxID=1428626 RepID=A0A1J4PUC7_9ACTN|nr:FadD3 family acyl-CoA ligase [Streptomyces malaysiense]OIK24314.1 fatty acid--CoA ligase [Streptomyces malaysiense]